MKRLQLPYAMEWWESLTPEQKQKKTKIFLDNKDFNSLNTFEILYLHKKSNQ